MSYQKDKLRQTIRKLFTFMNFHYLLFSLNCFPFIFVLLFFILLLMSYLVMFFLILIIFAQFFLKINYTSYIFLTIIILLLHHFTSHYYIFLTPYLSNCYCAILSHITPSLLHIFLHCSPNISQTNYIIFTILTVPQLFYNIPCSSD